MTKSGDAPRPPGASPFGILAGMSVWSSIKPEAMPIPDRNEMSPSRGVPWAFEIDVATATSWCDYVRLSTVDCFNVQEVEMLLTVDEAADLAAQLLAAVAKIKAANGDVGGGDSPHAGAHE